MADLENKNAKGLKDVRKTLEEKRKQKAALELELAMLEAEPNRKILISVIENDVKLNEKLIGLKADEVKIVAVHYVDLFKTALEESDAEIKELRAKAEQKRERARVRAAQRKKEKAEREVEQQNMAYSKVFLRKSGKALSAFLGPLSTVVGDL